MTRVSLTRVYQPLDGEAIRVRIDEHETSGYRYTFPDGFVHDCTQRDDQGRPECAFVNERATAMKT